MLTFDVAKIIGHNILSSRPATPTHYWTAMIPATLTAAGDVRYSASAPELQRQLYWLPIRQRRAYKLAVITYKTRLHRHPGLYLSQLIQDYQPARTLRLLDKLLHSVPRLTLALCGEAFNVTVSPIWISLSLSTV